MDTTNLVHQVRPNTPGSVAHILYYEYGIEIWKTSEFTATKYGKRHHYRFIKEEKQCTVRHSTMAHLVVEKHFGLDIPVLRELKLILK